MKPTALLEPLDEVSPIAAAAVGLGEHVLSKNSSYREEHQRLIDAALLRRQALIAELQAAGLLVLAVKYKDDTESRDEVFQDLSEIDDGKKLIESIARVRAFSAEQVKKIYEIAERHHLGVMTIGAKTSALGVFSTADQAKMHGLNGVLCIEMSPNWIDGKSPEEAVKKEGMPKNRRFSGGDVRDIKTPTDLIDLPKGLNEEDIIRSNSHPIAIILGKNGKRHQVVAHASATVSQVNAFLKLSLPADRRYQILSDLTSKDQASIGGVIATGAQGGNRASARVDITACTMVDEYGVRKLSRRGPGESLNNGHETAKDNVGYNGYTGTCIQATFEVTPFPPHDFGFLLPVSGNTPEEVWRNALEIQSRLTPYSARVRNGHFPEGNMKSCITSIEILGDGPFKHGVETVKDGSKEKTALLGFRERHKDAKMFLYVRGSSHISGLGNSEGLSEFIQEDFFTKALGITDIDGEELVLQEDEASPSRRVFPLLDSELLDAVDKMRHHAPEEARKEAIKIGNVSQSTDFNIQFHGSKAKKLQGMQKVAELYAKYQRAFEGGPYRIDIYGHGFLGLVRSHDGGGFDPHVRISLRLNDPMTRYDAPESVEKMKSILGNLYTDLLKLNRKFGVMVVPPEKSHLMIPKYVQHVRLHNPKKMKVIEERIVGKKNGNRSRKLTAGFRAPVEFPGEPRQGILSFLSEDLLPHNSETDELDAYSDAIMEVSQLSHRSPVIKGMFREVVATIREHLQLDPFTQHPFFTGSQEEADFAIQRNLGNDHQYPVVKISTPEELEALREQGQPAQNTFYLVSSEAFGGIPGMCVMITPHQAIIEADKRKQSGVNKESFRCLPDMFAQYPYETIETPNIPAIATIGLVLQRGELSEQTGSSRRRVVTMNPGPCGIDPRLRDSIRHEGVFKELSPEEQHTALRYFREFLKMPETMKLGMTGSSSECMQHLGQAMALNKEKIQAIQVINDAFGGRLNSVLKSHLGAENIQTTTTPWTTSESSQSEFVLKAIVPMIRKAMAEGKKPVLFVTPHKTSTTAHFHPSVLIEHLKQVDPPLVAGKDYEMVCDITSGAGVIDYFGEKSCRDGMSVFGSVQKGLGCPPGLGFVGLSPELQKLLCPEGQSSGLSGSIERTEHGAINNQLGIRLLGEKCRLDLEAGRTIQDIQEETRRKFVRVLGFMALHPDLCLQVPNSEDQSPLLIGMYSRTRNLSVAARLMEEIFGYSMGGGYGPFAGESLRLYLPSIQERDLDRFLHAFNYVLSRPEVTETVNKEAPLISLREPHDPLAFLKRMRDEFVPDDVFQNSVGMEWIGRIVNTYENCEDSAYDEGLNGQLLKSMMRYYSSKGISLAAQLLTPAGRIRELRDIMLKKGTLNIAKVRRLVANIKSDLAAVVEVLEDYAKSDVSMKTEDGRVIWPFAATKEQLREAA